MGDSSSKGYISSLIERYLGSLISCKVVLMAFEEAHDTLRLTIFSEALCRDVW